MWDILWWILLILYVPACIGLIIIVLLQKGKGAGFAGAFGVGPGSETVFGPQTAQGTPVKITYAMAAMFMTIALLMSIISGRVGAGVAPELEDETAMTDTAPATTGLEEFGLGTGVTGQVDSSAITVDAPATATPADAPAAAETPAAAEAPAAEAPATAAPVSEAPAAEAPVSEAPAEETPAAEAPADAPAPAAETQPAPAEEPAMNEPAVDAPALNVPVEPAPQAQ